MKDKLGVKKFIRLVRQQDVVACHTVNTVMDYLDTVIGPTMHALKSRKGVAWSLNSSDLNPCDFWLWAYLKSLVHEPMPHSLPSLIERIRTVCQDIPQDMIRRSILSMKKEG